MRLNQERKEALQDLTSLLCEINSYIDIVLVEGNRDVDSLRSLGCSADIDVLSHKGVNDFDLADQLSKFNNVLILTDFDEEGINLNKRFKSLLEHKSVTVEDGVRRRVGRFMAKLNVYAIESLDNIKTETE